MDKNLLFSAIALTIYISGGLATFIGIFLLVTTMGKDLGNTDEHHALGYFLVLVGLVFSVAGVIIMKTLRK